MSEDSVAVSFPANHTTLTDGYYGIEKMPILVYDSSKISQSGTVDYSILNPQQNRIDGFGDMYLSGIFTYTRQKSPHDLVADYYELVVTPLTQNNAVRIALIRATTIDETTHYDNVFHYPVQSDLRDSIWKEICSIAVDTCTINVLRPGVSGIVRFPLSYATKMD